MNAEAGDYVTVVYAPEKKLYVREVVKNDEHDFRVSFLQHTGVLTELSIFRKPKKEDIVWVAQKNILSNTAAHGNEKRFINTGYFVSNICYVEDFSFYRFIIVTRNE